MFFSELNLNKEITAKKLNQLEKKGIHTVNDMVRFTPKGYYDYSKETKLSDAVSGQRCAFHLIIKGCQKRMGSKVPFVKATCETIDGSEKLSVTWFDQYIYETIHNLVNKEVIVAGLFEINDYGKQIVNPDVFCEYNKEVFRIYPIYKKIPGMSNEYFINILNHCIDEYKTSDMFTEKFKKQFNIVDEITMINGIHRPKDREELVKAYYRLSVEKFYPFCETMVEMSEMAKKTSIIKLEKMNLCHKVISSLPYELTKDQKDILNKFVIEARKGKRINALIQGDVGSGKTIVSFILMMVMVDNGYQAVLMAPTGILAKQHYEDLKKLVEPLGVKVAFIASGMKTSLKKEILQGLSDGSIDIVVGTHAVISDNVEFKCLGITVVDEEHKFGVIQRENLKKKANEGVHNISMSATPIPRSLAQTMYGDCVDVYTIMSMPKGRLPIKTAIVNNIKTMFNFMKKEIENGHQCYMVCPLIDLVNSNSDLIDEDDDKKRPYSVKEVVTMAESYFKNSNIKVAAVTGKMKEDEKSYIIEAFERNEYQVLIATSIIEVGVNVPNATVISIMNAERFGLAGLHQLRGRVGRNSLQSYCMMYSEDIKNSRLEIMCKTTNGFEIANEDLKLRGTGDIIGLKQSGEDRNIIMMLKYPKLYDEIKSFIFCNR